VGGVTSNLWEFRISIFGRECDVVVVESHLVAKTLGGNDGDLIADALVGLEVEGQLGVVTLDDDLSGALDCLFEES
jgi:hypothetical protein